MRTWPDMIVRITLATAFLVLGWSLLGTMDLVPRTPDWVVGLGWIVAIGTLGLAAWSRVYQRRILPSVVQDEASLHVNPGGSFTWRPAGEPRPSAMRHLPIHSWWDSSRGRVAHASVAFEVADEVPPELLAKATKKGLSAASGALPGRGKVRAKAAAQDKAGPMTLVRVRLEVRGIGADPTWARAASEAFARVFLAQIERRDHAAERVA